MNHTTNTHTVVTHEIELDATEQFELLHEFDGHPFKVDRLRLEYVRDSDDEDPWDNSRVYAFGYKIKKNGKVGAQRTSDWWYFSYGNDVVPRPVFEIVKRAGIVYPSLLIIPNPKEVTS